MKRTIATLTLCLAASTLHAQSGDLKYADHLYGEKDYFRAVSEYKRYLFHDAGGRAAIRARFFIPLSYYHAGRPREALDKFLLLKDGKLAEPWAGRVVLMSSLCALRAGMAEVPAKLSAEYLGQERELGKAARVLHFYLLLKAGEFDRAAASVPAGREELGGLVAAGRKVSYKSERKAAFLSLLPGAGQLYAARPADALPTLVLNALTTAAAVYSFKKDRIATGAAFCVLESGWYFGNLYTAANCARRTNRERQERYLSRVEEELDMDGVIVEIEQGVETGSE